MGKIRLSGAKFGLIRLISRMRKSWGLYEANFRREGVSREACGGFDWNSLVNKIVGVWA